jgi:type III pantothenate kinase
MKLLVDIGNQNLKWSFGEALGSFPSSLAKFADNFDKCFGQLENVTDLAFVNVAGRNTENILKDLTRTKWGIHATKVLPALEQCGVRNGYRNINELGADRWAALVGAWSLNSTASIVVDCGTAITIDALSFDGEFVGGSIVPGFRLSQGALWRNAPGIEEFVDLNPALPARSTIEAVSSGVVYGIVGGVDRLIEKYRNIVGGESQLVLTGGDAQFVQKNSTFKFLSVPHLVLFGIDVIAG